jgi:F-type H+-transporting ATPase subunit delta
MNKAIENENKLVSQRYAQALLELAEDGKISKEKILAELTDIVTSVENSYDLMKVMNSPVISGTEKKNVIVKLFEKDNSKVVVNFLQLLIDKNKFGILSSVVKEFTNEVNKQKNKLLINVTSAIKLSNSDKAMIKVKMSKVLKKEIELEWFVNEEIIAGLIFEANDNIVDNSLRHKLQELNRKIIK